MPFPFSFSMPAVLAVIVTGVDLPVNAVLFGDFLKHRGQKMLAHTMMRCIVDNATSPAGPLLFLVRFLSGLSLATKNPSRTG